MALKRILGVGDGLAVTVGIVIGAGILRTPGLIAGYLGDPWLILAVWTLGGVVAGLSTIVLAEMAAALPQAGGKYVYAREAWGPLMGFVAGWSELLVTRGFSGATKAIIIAEYVRALTGVGSITVMAAMVVIAFFFLHLSGLRVSALFQRVTTAVKVGVIFVIAAAGLYAGNMAGFTAASAPASAASFTWLGFALAYQSVSFAYYGWEDAAKMAEEVANPGRALPRILLGGAIAVAALYLLINISFLAALTPAQMAGSPLVARDATAAVFGNAAGTVVVIASLLILISSINVNFLGLPRVAYGLSKDGLAFKRFSEVDSRSTPRIALYFVAGWIGVLAVTGAFQLLINFMMMVAISVDTMVLLSWFRLRATQPNLARPFKVPFGPVLPVVTIVLYIAILAIMVGTQPMLAVGGGSMILGLIVGGLVTIARTGARPVGSAVRP
ncbi:MAG TPA: amino acid permease [Vicinamibacterales bacterium]|nr:amino acid permease [Vicinamibacterales bacterium]